MFSTTAIATGLPWTERTPRCCRNLTCRYCIMLTGVLLSMAVDLVKAWKALAAIDCVQVSCRCVLPTWEVAEYAAPAEPLIFLVIYYP